MREILFRGKVSEDEEFLGYKKNQWIYGNYSYDKFCDNIHIEDTSNEDIVSIEVDPETVGEYTGLEDENGKKIFEGDVVKYKQYDDEGNLKQYLGRVYFNIVSCCFCIFFKDGGFMTDDFFEDSYYIEVIGNIYDNPELLEEQP